MPGVSVHGGVEVTANAKPGDRGYSKWNSCTELHSDLVKNIDRAMAKRVTSTRYHATTRPWAGADFNWVRSDKLSRGKVIGRG
jgi:hypothetical protein